MRELIPPTGRRVRGPLSPTSLLAMAAILTGCSYPGQRVERDALEMARFEYSVPGRDGWTISAAKSGEGVRVVYIHGTPGDAKGWAGYVLDPVAGTESVAPDRPGFGRTTPRKAVPSLADQAAAIEPLLVERDGQWPILVGHSLGGPIALRVAAEHPDKVGAVVVLAGSVDPDEERVLFIQRLGNFAFIPALLPRALRNANREVLPLERELEDLAPLLERVTCPVVVVHGTRDRLVPYANVAYLEDRLAANQRTAWLTLDGEDHFFIWTRPEIVRAAVERAIAMMAGDTPVE
ncbi:MAG: alpha/beta fold hydrolase [Phycisphaerales bacterium]